PTPPSSAPSAAAPPDWLVSLFSRTLGIPEPDLNRSAHFGDLGVESVMLAQLLTDIEGHVGRPLEPSTLLDHSTLEALGGFLVGSGLTQPEAPRVSIVTDSSTMDNRVAVIGMACRLPGASDIDAYWELLRDGRCAVTEVPPG